MKNIIPDSLLTCPHCNEQSSIAMPEDSCLYFLECPNCSQLLRPEKGDCCVFCSYGDTPCPPVQKSRAC